MNPVTYCAFTSCSDKDWEVFGVMALIAIGVVIVLAIADYMVNKFGKDRDMK